MTSESDMLLKYAAFAVLLHIFTVTEQQIHGRQTQYKVSNKKDKNELLVEVFYCKRYV